MLSVLSKPKVPESLSGKFCAAFSGCCKGIGQTFFGGVLGAACGVVKPAAEWMLNVWEKATDKNSSFKGRMAVLIDIGAAAVVMAGSVLRFGEPASYFFATTAGLLSAYGTYKGITLSFTSSNQALSLCGKAKEISKELWVFGENVVAALEAKTSQANTSQTTTYHSERSLCSSIVESMKGAAIGCVAGALMPFAQLLKTILAAKRKWPVLINTGAINIYAWYVGTVLIGSELSLFILAGLEGTLTVYGLGKGAFVGYTQSATLVPTRLWEGGLGCEAAPALSSATAPSSVTVPSLPSVTITSPSSSTADGTLATTMDNTLKTRTHGTHAIIQPATQSQVQPIHSLSTLANSTMPNSATSTTLISAMTNSANLSEKNCQWMYEEKKSSIKITGGSNLSPHPYKISVEMNRKQAW